MIINPSNRLHSVKEYYFSSKLKEIANLNKRGRDIINLGIGSPDLPPSEEVMEELHLWASKPTSHGYQSYSGLPEFREAISRWLKKIYQVDADPSSEILPLMGSKEGIMHISMALTNPGDKVLVPNPGYPTYSSVTELVQAEAIAYDLDESGDWQLDMDHFRQLPLEEIKLMWLNYPHMPTGARGSTEQFNELIRLAQKHKFLIVNDNPYSLLFTGAPTSIFHLPDAWEVCLELNSMSKSHNMAGWRLGWVLGKRDYLEAIIKVKSNMDSGMFLPVQKAAMRALQLGDDWYDGVRAIYKDRKEVATEILDVIGCTYDHNQEGMFVWGKVPDTITNLEAWIGEIMLDAGVFLTPGFIFGSKGNRYIRISLCSKKDVLNEALTRIKAYLKK